ncbi:hypothetical protein CAPN002_17970 [Capnocytophaga stomatis]|uniref:AAA family ATPase n=1 Tax=Capnocytophaga stomatis TaxID=1848904 RepID=UPI00194F119C|nr:AAA family ATPase [Capnocytophaga stomatis]GIJ94579.1 hypothetical protein CAPN002_17970 [Capnocytophaga stomatis]
METTERLYLKNFGPIKELDIEIKPLMVFIGESGSGKSAILKLMSLLRWIHKKNNLRFFFNKVYSFPKEDFSFQIEELFETSSIDEFISKDTQIIFRTNEVEYRYKNSKFIYPREEELKHVSLHKVAFISENRGILPDIYTNTIYKKSHLGRRDWIALPYYLNDTYDLFDTAYKKIGKKFHINSTELEFSYTSEDRLDFFIKGNNFKIKLENASSGTKTALPIELIVHYLTQHFKFEDVLKRGLSKYLFSNSLEEIINNTSSIEGFFGHFQKGFEELSDNDIGNEELSIFIEEPELSLFPAAQRRLINRLVKDCFVENKQENCTTRLAFATHSPYILTSLNNLLLAGEIAKLKPEKEEEINKIIPKAYWLTMEQIGVFSIENGIVKPAIYEDENLINGDYLDSISEEISEEFSKLLDIKYEEEAD